MNKISQKIVFFGTDDFSLATLQKLVESNYNVTAVVTKPDSKSGRGQLLSISIVKKFAMDHNIAVWQPSEVSEINENIKTLGANIVGILSSFGKIIPESTIDLFSPGIINIHPSLLPLYRGPSPIESTILNGDTQTGVSIMRLTSKMDEGPIYGHILHQLSGNETSPELYQTLAQAGAVALISLLPAILDGSLQPVPQDNSKTTYCKLLTKDDCWLNPEKMSAESAERMVRAYLNFPKTKIKVNNYTIIITKSYISNEQKNILDIKCSDGKYLSISELIAPSGRKMSENDFLNGYA